MTRYIWVLSCLLSLPTTLIATETGRMPGEFGVDSRGNASYTIPIRAPGGIGEMTPQIALRYNSAGGSDVGGYGWSLTGASSISRCVRTLAQDGQAGGVRADATDAICLDGQKLILTSGVHGAETARYSTEVDDFRVVAPKLSGGAGPSATHGPQWFEVNAGEGLVAEYGRTVDARQNFGSSTIAAMWQINRVRDRFGNYVDYEYDLDSAGGIRLKSVKYTGTQSATPFAEIRMNYGPRNRPIYSYLAGARFGTSSLLQSVEVFSAGQLAWTYTLNHSWRSQSKKHMLDSVKLCGSGDCFPATTFNYFTDSNLGGFGGLASSSTHDIGSYSSTSPTGDFDGDGTTDVVYTKVSTGQYFARFANRTNGVFGSHYTLPVAVTTGRPGHAASAMTSDLDGDGRADILIAGSVGANWFWEVVSYNGQTNQFTSQRLAFQSGDPAGGMSGQPIDYSMADIDGDGLDDLIYTDINRTTGAGERQIEWFKNLGGSFASTAVVLLTSGSGPDPDQSVVTDVTRSNSGFVDVNGDLRADVYFMNSSSRDGEVAFGVQQWFAFSAHDSGYQVTAVSQASFRNEPTVVPGDINGDGITDWVHTQTIGSISFPQNRLHIGVGIGDGRMVVQDTYGFPLDRNVRYSLIIDYDGDGYGDLLNEGFTSGGGPGTHYRVYQSNGESLDQFYNSTLPVPDNYVDMNTGDLNGDGLMDLFWYQDGRWHRRLFNGTGVENKLQTVTDGQDLRFDVSYKSVSDPTVHVPLPDDPSPTVRPLRGGTKVVNSTTETASGATQSIKTYTYHGGRIDTRGRGFLGFEQREVLDLRDNVPSRYVTEYFQDFPYIGVVAAERRHVSSGQVVSEKVSEVSTHETAGALGGSTFVPYVSKTTSTTRELDGALTSTTVTDIEVDAFGNETARDTVVSSSAGVVSTTNVRSSFLNDRDGSGCYKLETNRQTISANAAGELYERNRDITHDLSTCRVATIVDDPGTLYERTTVLGYDQWGNVESSATTARAGYDTQSGQISDVVTRATESEFGPDGRFVRSQQPVIHGVDLTTYTVWETALGVATQSIDQNGQTTVTDYDGLARTTQVTMPDGSVVETNRTGPRAAYGTFIQWQRMSTRKAGQATGGTTWAGMDAYGREIYSAQTVSAGVAHQYVVYDDKGRVVERTVPSLTEQPVYRTTYEYDELDRVVRMVSPADEARPTGSVTTYSYAAHAFGTEITKTDPRGNQTVTVKDPLGRDVSVTDAGGGTTAFAYHANGQVKSATNPDGGQTTWDYDLRGNPSVITNPDRGSRAVVHNAFDEQVAQRNANNQLTTFSYDVVGRTVSRARVEGTISWTYDGATNGLGLLNQVSVPDSAYTETMAYDALSRLSSVVRTESGVSYQEDTNYDAFGRVRETALPAHNGAGARVTFVHHYNAAGQRDRVSLKNGPDLWTATAGDPFGNFERATTSNGWALDWDRDRATGRSVRVAGAGPGGTGFETLTAWDLAGNLDSRENARHDVAEYPTYDTLNRLTNLDTVDLGCTDGGCQPQSKSFAFSVGGNTTNTSELGDYSYDPGSQAVLSAGNHGFVYDDNGAFVSKTDPGAGDVTAQWASFERPLLLRQYFEVPEEGGLPIPLPPPFGDLLAGDPSATAECTEAFTYTHMDTRATRRSVCAANDGSGSTISQDLRAVYAGGLYQKVTDFRLGATVHRYFIPGPFERIVGVVQVADGQTASTIRYFQRDHLNSINGLLSDSGLEAWSFDAQGQRRALDWVGPAPAAPAAINGIAFDFGFGGHEHLSTIGLVLMGARVYDPVIGRMLQADPLIPGMADGQAHNRYAYVLNNPLTYLDPTGYSPAAEDDVVEFEPIEINPPKHPAPASLGGGGNAVVMRVPTTYAPTGSHIKSVVAKVLDDPASSYVAFSPVGGGTVDDDDAHGQFGLGGPSVEERPCAGQMCRARDNEASRDQVTALSLGIGIPFPVKLDGEYRSLELSITVGAAESGGMSRPFVDIDVDVEVNVFLLFNAAELHVFEGTKAQYLDADGISIYSGLGGGILLGPSGEVKGVSFGAGYGGKFLTKLPLVGPDISAFLNKGISFSLD